MNKRDYLEKLRATVEKIQRRSPNIPPPPDEILMPEGLDIAAPQLEGAALETAQLEAIVHWYRPVYEIADDRFIVSQNDSRFIDPDAAASKALIETLNSNRGLIDPSIRSVGRIELQNNSTYPEMAGTGWIIDIDGDNDIVVTNAHVANLFAERAGSRFVFRPGTPDSSLRQAARIDFREELRESASREFAVTDIIWVAPNEKPDMALLRVARMAGSDRLSGPILLQEESISDDDMLAVIGYPGSGHGYEIEPFRKVFGEILMKKRLSPGFFDASLAADITYDCSTLPGSSGSVVLNIATGKAVGLHYSGAAFSANYGVSVPEIKKVIRNRPWQVKTSQSPLPLLTEGTDTSDQGNGKQDIVTTDYSVSSNSNAISVTVPLRISVSLGDDRDASPLVTLGDSDGHRKSGSPATTDRESATRAAKRVRQHLAGHPDVLSVTADRLFRDGSLSDDFGVIVGLAPGARAGRQALGLPERYMGGEISLETASPLTIAEERLGIETEAFSGRKAGYERDLGDPRFTLDPVTDDMKMTLHVSPEAGWPVLKKFLSDDRFEQFTVGIYHMTAPHVVDALKAIARRRRNGFTLTLDRQRGDLADNPDDTSGGTKANDIPERDTLTELQDIAGDRFQWTPAALSKSGLFPTAYHIKAAVWTDRLRGRRKEDKLFWLSSGNWQSSNLAPVDTAPGGDDDGPTLDEIKDYNREWHAVVEHPGLAATFRHHLEQDYEDNKQASAREAFSTLTPDILVPDKMLERVPSPSEFRTFAPLELDGEATVQPLLTPDNYPDEMLRLIRGARERLLIENQSFNLWKDINRTPRHFLDIVQAVLDKKNEGLDVRIIFRSGFGSERERLRRMREFGFDVGHQHVRFFDKCHTKGLVIDNDAVVLGSQNWTAAGTGPNRDASLLIRHPQANAYFADLFEYDWAQLARNFVRLPQSVPSPVITAPAGAEGVVPQGYLRMSLAEFLGET